MRLKWRFGLAALTVLLVVMVASWGCGKKDAKAPNSKDKKPVEEEITGPPVFEDITKLSGVELTYRNGEEAGHYSILESLGGGAGLIDYDGDGLLDLFLTGGGGYEGADKKTIVGLPSKFYRNLGQGKFKDITAEVGLDKLAGGKPWFYTHGVAVTDFDRDGHPDLLVTGWGAVALFRNVPVDANDPKKGRRFEDVTAKAGLDKGIEWTTSAGFADFDGDGYPDLYICQYVDWSWKNHPLDCNYDGGKTRDVCPPLSFSGLKHKLYRNTGKGGFVDVSNEAGLRDGGPSSSKGLGVVIVDADGDRKPDIYVANDTVDNFLYINKSTPGKLLFSEEGLTSGVARDDRGGANGSMGVDAGDPERVGKPYIWVTNYENELHALYGNKSEPGKPFFLYLTKDLNIAAIGQKYVGWGTAFVDVDLDGWEDLFMVNGHAIRHPAPEVGRKQKPVLMLNRQGKFRLASKMIGDYHTQHLARGVAFGDLDNDGRIDMAINHTNEPTSLLRGIGGKENHWLGVQLVGKDQACVVGSKVVLEVDGQKQTRFGKSGGSYLSANDPRMVFGLGKSKPGRLTVTWPDGTEQQFDNLEPDRYHRIVQGAR